MKQRNATFLGFTLSRLFSILTLYLIFNPTTAKKQILLGPGNSYVAEIAIAGSCGMSITLPEIYETVLKLHLSRFGCECGLRLAFR